MPLSLSVLQQRYHMPQIGEAPFAIGLRCEGAARIPFIRESHQSRQHAVRRPVAARFGEAVDHATPLGRVLLDLNQVVRGASTQ